MQNSTPRISPTSQPNLGTWILWHHKPCSIARAVFCIFLFAKLPISFYTEISPLSVNLKFSPLPAVLSWRLTAKVVNNFKVFVSLD